MSQIIQKWLMWILLKECFSSISFPIYLKHLDLVVDPSQENCVLLFLPKRIDNIFDKVVTPSIKDNECNIRAQGLDIHNTAYEISGLVQKRPIDFLGALRNNTFEQALIRFFSCFKGK